MTTRSEAKAALRKARKANDVLAAIADGVWAKAHDGKSCPDDMTPTPAEMAEWLHRCPRSVLATVWEICRPWLADVMPGEPCSSLAAVTSAAAAGLPWKIDPGPWHGDPESAPWAARWIAVPWETMLESVTKTIEASHAAWMCLPKDERGRHPFGPFVKEWQNRPLIAEPDTKPNAIMANPLAGSPALNILPAPRGLDWTHPDRGGLRLPSAADAGRLHRHAQHLFSDFDPDGPHVEIPPVLPLAAFDLAGGKTHSRGRGAPLPLRIHTEALLACPTTARHHPCEIRWPTAREFMRGLWPNRKPKGTEFRAMLQGLLTVDNMRVSAGGSLWRTVGVWALPESWDAPLVLIIRLPDGSHVGPLVNRPELRIQGVRSAPRYRAYLGLSALRNKYGTHKGKIIPAIVPEVQQNRAGQVLDAQGRPLFRKNGKPANWRHPRRVETGRKILNKKLLQKLPWLNQAARVQLCFPEAILGSRPVGKLYAAQYDRKAKKALRGLAADGLIRIVREFPENPKGRGRRGRWKVVLTDHQGSHATLPGGKA